MENTVYIVVDGGAVQGVFTETGAEIGVVLIDHDNRRAADDEEADAIQADADFVDEGLENGSLQCIF